MVKQKKHKLENLVVLSYSKANKAEDNPVISLNEAEKYLISQVHQKNFLINIEEGTWSYLDQTKIPIERSIIPLKKYNGNGMGVIGVYNRMSTPDLISMTRAAQWARVKRA